MPTVFPRDRALDQTLESEARLTLILVGVGIGLLFLTTAAIYFGYRLVHFLRPVLSQSSHIANTTEAERTVSEIADNWSCNMSVSQSKPSLPRKQSEQERTPTSRIPSLFASIRKHPSAPHRPTGVYTGPNRSPFPRPPPVRLASPSAQSEIRNTPAAPQGVVTPHIAEWMKVADSVVGRHPDAQPLCTRVATQAEVDLISGYVHVPWAFRGKPKSQPIPVKVMKPVVSAPASALTPATGQPPVKPSVLKDVGNIRGRDISITVNKASKRSPKGKPIRRAAHGKENMPAVPSPLAQSGRRN